jgi:hypothetical protein
MRKLRLWIALTVVFVSSFASAQTIDAYAPVVLARSRPTASAPDPCTTQMMVPIPNCFTYNVATGTWSPQDLWSLTGWIWTTRNPSSSSPLLVDIGPGTFGTFHCNGTNSNGTGPPIRGYVTLRGSGREQTILKGPDGADITDCTTLSFIDLGVQGRRGVYWTGAQGGYSSWSNVDLVGLGTLGPPVGWGDALCAGQTIRSVHYFHGSRIRAIVSGSVAYAWPFSSNCAESRIFGGEILLDVTGGQVQSTFADVIFLQGGYLETVGTAIRGSISGSGSSSALIGANIGDSGGGSTLPAGFDNHGGSIELSTNQAIPVIAINASGNVTVNSQGTAYDLSPGSSAAATRLAVSSPAVVDAPYQWSAGNSPPAITSLNGQDTFVETDCSSTGSCGSGSQPHLMIYSSACTGANGPWFDLVRQMCR